MSLAGRLEQLRSQLPPDPPAIPGTRAFSLADVGPGWKIFSVSRFVAGDPDYPEPLGGLCLEVLHVSSADPETGEILEQTAYRCLATWRPAPFQYPTLAAGEIDLGQLAGSSRHSIELAVRWLCRPVAGGRGWLSGRESQAITDAWRLVAAANLRPTNQEESTDAQH